MQKEGEEKKVENIKFLLKFSEQKTPASRYRSSRMGNASSSSLFLGSLNTNSSSSNFDGTEDFPENPNEGGGKHSVTGTYADINEVYLIDSSELGHGHYGKVRVGVHRISGKKYAVKTIPKLKDKRLGVLRNEVAILKVKLYSFHLSVPTNATVP